MFPVDLLQVDSIYTGKRTVRRARAPERSEGARSTCSKSMFPVILKGQTGMCQVKGKKSPQLA